MTRWKSAFVAGTILQCMGLPLLIVGSTSTGGDTSMFSTVMNRGQLLFRDARVCYLPRSRTWRTEIIGVVVLDDVTASSNWDHSSLLIVRRCILDCAPNSSK